MTEKATLADLKLYNGTASNEVVKLHGYYTVGDGGGGEFVWDAASTATANDGTIVKAPLATGRWLRIYSGHVNVKWFGAKADFVSTSTPGTDDTAKIQKALDWLMINESGGTLFFPEGKYNVKGTLYVDPPSPNFQKPITLLGCVEDTKDGLTNPILSGTSLVRYLPPAITGSSDPNRLWKEELIRVNYTKDGYNNLPGLTLYCGLTIDGFNLIALNDVEAGGIKMFRTRGTYKNIACHSLKYLIDQPAVDAAGTVKNYCDQSTYENLRIVKATDSGVNLNHNDGSNISGFYFEYPKSTCKHAISLTLCSSINISGAVSANDPAVTLTSDSSLFLLDNCNNISLTGIHMENIIFKAAFEMKSCIGVAIKNIHVRFSSYDVMSITNSKGIDINGWHAWEDKQTGYFDIRYYGTADFNQSITWDNCFFEKYTTAGVQRDILIKDAQLSKYSHGRIIHAHVFWDDTAWKVLDSRGTDLTVAAEGPKVIAKWATTFDADGVTFEAPYNLVSMVVVSPHYTIGTGPAHTPQVVQYTPEVRVQFIDTAGTGSRVTTRDKKMNFDVILAQY